MKKKVCIIGVNYSYHVLFNSLKILKKFEVIGVAGKKKREKFSSENFIYFTSWKKMIKTLKPKLVIVAVPPLEQEKILKFLLIEKIDFLCEKPITNKIKKINLFKKLSNQNLNKKIVDLNFLTIPAIKKFKEIIKKIKIDKKDKISVDWLFRPKSFSDKLSWKNDITKVGGDLNNFLFHLLSVIFYFFGNFEISLIQKKKNSYIFLIKLKKIVFNINFCSRSKKNKFKIEINKKNNKYTLINNSKDYHNNFYIIKNNSIIFKKNFLKNNSRVFASMNILQLFIKNNRELLEQINFDRGLEIQKKIIDLKC